MLKFMKQIDDLEDAFRLDCNDEDIRNDPEAKKLAKMLKKCRKRTDRYYKFLCRKGFYTQISKNEFYVQERGFYMNNKKSGAGGGIGFFGLLTIVFIVLKLLNVISWSWWWVLSPLWIPVALGIVIWLIACIVAIFLNRR